MSTGALDLRPTVVVGVPLQYWQFPNQPLRVMQNAAYLHALTRAGAVVLPIPPTDVAAARLLAARCDAVCLPGGPDIDPCRYGETLDPALGVVPLPSADDLEVALLTDALDRGQPVLGICRGLQLLNVVHGGSLWQDLPQQTGRTGHRGNGDGTGPEGAMTTRHPVEVLPGTRLATLVGSGTMIVNSRHHQAIRQLGDGLRISARATDGTVEAVECVDHPFALAVQWHPEELGGTISAALFAALVRAGDRHRPAQDRLVTAPRPDTPAPQP